MGLNWSAGLGAAAEGLQVMAGRQARKEDQELEQLRQENFARLQHGLARERDERNFEQQKDIQKSLFKQQSDLQEQRDTAAGERQAARDDASFKKQLIATEAAENRAWDREASRRESETRRSDEGYRRNLASQRQKAIDDIARVKKSIAAYQKQKGSEMMGTGISGFSQLAQTDEFAASLLYDLREADKRRRELDAQIGEAPRPSTFSQNNRGTSAPQSQLLIPDSGF